MHEFYIKAAFSERFRKIIRCLEQARNPGPMKNALHTRGAISQDGKRLPLPSHLQFRRTFSGEERKELP